MASYRSISRIPKQSQYELSHHFFGLNANRFHPIFPVFGLPDELILSIVSHVSPDPPPHAGHYARFRVRHSPGIDDYHQRRMEFLRALSMTCRAMRLRLSPWVWERLRLPPSYRRARSGNVSVRKLDTLMNILRTNVCLAASVK